MARAPSHAQRLRAALRAARRRGRTHGALALGGGVVKLSVVIATRDRAAFLSKALDSLGAQVGAPAFEVVVVDNGSSDATPEVVATHAARGSLASAASSSPNPIAAPRATPASPSRAARSSSSSTTTSWLPEGFLAAHAAAHDGVFPLAVSGPILNVPSYAAAPLPGPLNYSRAFFCTCNVSLPRTAFDAAGGFDADFNLYGWEDTELGLRLRRRDVRRAFAWKAYLYHIKPPRIETLDAALNKTVERARMAARFMAKDDGPRTRLATGAYALNLWRAQAASRRVVAGRGAARRREPTLPAPLRALARAQLLDAAYVSDPARSAGGAEH
jgi:GT2 family glycosyltransferase